MPDSGRGFQMPVETQAGPCAQDTVALKHFSLQRILHTPLGLSLPIPFPEDI